MPILPMFTSLPLVPHHLCATPRLRCYCRVVNISTLRKVHSLRLSIIQEAVHNTCVVHAAALDFSSSNTEHYSYASACHAQHRQSNQCLLHGCLKIDAHRHWGRCCLLVRLYYEGKTDEEFNALVRGAVACRVLSTTLTSNPRVPHLRLILRCRCGGICA